MVFPPPYAINFLGLLLTELKPLIPSIAMNAKQLVKLPCSACASRCFLAQPSREA